MTTANAQERIPAFNVGDRLRKAREKTGLDQEGFAQSVGISRGTVSNYERATSTEGLKKPYLAAWALRADVPVEWLTEGQAPGGGDHTPAAELDRTTPEGSMDTCDNPDRLSVSLEQVAA